MTLSGDVIQLLRLLILSIVAHFSPNCKLGIAKTGFIVYTVRRILKVR